MNTGYKDILAVLFVLFYLIILFLLTSCSGTITVKLTNPEGISNNIEVETARRTLVSIDGAQVTIITGQVAISDETVQALGRTAPQIFQVPFPQQ